MRAIWSFWSKPFLAQQGSAWISSTYHLLSWILSVQVARPHFQTTVLVTDELGASMLVERLGLTFDRVSTELEALRDQDARWWVLGKLLTYSRQVEPFVHVDSDVYLWEPLPRRILEADVLGQNLEHFDFDRDPWYRPQRLSQVIQRAHGWVPEEWAWYMAQHGHTAVCCGIFGGHRTDFIRQYADRALAFAMHPLNAPAWKELPDLADHCVLLEQYLLNAMLAYGSRHTSQGSRVQLQCLFESEAAEHSGTTYTHLMGSRKKDSTIATKLADTVRHDYPDSFDRLVRYLAHLDQLGAVVNDRSNHRALRAGP